VGTAAAAAAAGTGQVVLRQQQQGQAGTQQQQQRRLVLMVQQRLRSAAPSLKVMGKRWHSGSRGTNTRSNSHDSSRSCSAAHSGCRQQHQGVTLARMLLLLLVLMQTVTATQRRSHSGS
jgi:hypothetical protein